MRRDLPKDALPRFPRADFMEYAERYWEGLCQSLKEFEENAVARKSTAVWRENEIDMADFECFLKDCLGLRRLISGGSAGIVIGAALLLAFDRYSRKGLTGIGAGVIE